MASANVAYINWCMLLHKTWFTVQFLIGPFVFSLSNVAFGVANPTRTCPVYKRIFRTVIVESSDFKEMKPLMQGTRRKHDWEQHLYNDNCYSVTLYRLFKICSWTC